ncbi:HemK2/MTQ2 family protein methyltransferase (plasmid) [Streptomyces sp. BI20]|uniref:HemK2/MTQ2 family protein methyltransferase n=1 Tax=Streptomyces sp. BI20 TaxID=3403460 RepID=UPI003C79319F
MTTQPIHPLSALAPRWSRPVSRRAVAGARALFALPGVYRPQADTRMLLDALVAEAPGPAERVLEIGTGTGAVALAAARLGCAVTAVDVSWAAVLSARLNARRQRLPVDVRHGDFAARTGGRRFDLVVANPPYVPSPLPEPPGHGAARAWEGGGDGRAVVDRICALARRLLNPGGRLLMVHSALSGPDATVEALGREGMRAEVVGVRHVPWGPVLRSRRDWLETHGLAEPGSATERLVVIRGRRA